MIPEITARVVTIADEDGGLRLIIGIDGEKMLSVNLTEDMLDLLASEIILHRKRTAKAA